MRHQPKHFFEFGPFRLDIGERLLFRDGELVPLAPKVFEILFLLVGKSGHIVEKDDLMKVVWPGTFVEEYSLTRNISILRKALGEGDAEQQFIETIPKRGYRFVADVQERSDEAVGGAVLPNPVVQPDEPAGPEVNRSDPQTGPAQAAPLSKPRPDQVRGRANASRLPLLAAGLVLLIGVTFVFSQFISPDRSNSAAAGVVDRSVAILPFKLLGADGGDEEISLALADALITKLSNVRQVVVRPTSAVLKYNNPTQDPVTAGRELKVEHVLEGSIRRLGDRIRVTVQLVRVGDGVPLWAEKLDEQTTDLFAAEDSVSEKLAGALTLRLTGKERGLVSRRPTENSEAYRDYLMGRSLWNRRTPESLKKAIEYFNHAIEKDANFALAYAGLADCYSQLTYHSVLPPKLSFPRAEASAARALELDANLTEAHTSLAYIKEYHLDWAAAEAEYGQAIRLNPNYPVARHWHSLYLAKMGRFDEALAEVQRAQELDPLSLVINAGAGRILYWARKSDRAIEQCRRTLEIDPNFALAYRFLGLALAQKGNYAEAVTALEKARSLAAGDNHTLASLGYVYAVAGRRGEALKVLQELQNLSGQAYVSAYSIAIVYAGLGEKDRAFEWIEKAFDNRSAWLPFLKHDPAIESLRSDPRFAELLRRLRLPV